MAGLTASGLGSGIDVKSLVEQLVSAERQPVANRLNLKEARTNSELSALGKLKSALSQFRDTLAALKDLPSFQGRKVTVSDGDLLAASAGSNAVPGSYDIGVVNLATSQKLASPAFVDGESSVGSGMITISMGGSSSVVVIPESASSLRDIRDAINSAPDNPGVKATIVTANDGARLILNGTDTGVANAFSVTVSGGDGGLAPLAFDPQAGDNPMTVVHAAADATLLIDGFEVHSASNTVTGAVEGLTLNLKAVKPDTTVTVAVNYDQESARNLVTGFVNAYNKLVDTIAEVTRYNVETREAAPLLGDPAVRAIRDGLRREITGHAPAGTGETFSSLAMIGITTENDGKLKIDATKLGSAIDADFDAVGRLFAGDGGLARRVDGIAEGTLAGSGTLAIREGNLKSNLKTITGQREALEARLEQVRSRLDKQFNAMDRLLGQLRNTSDYLAQQLTGL